MKIGNLKKRVMAVALAAGVLVVGVGAEPAFAADIRSANYNLYYNSPGNYSGAQTAEITYYRGTNYFQLSTLSGSSATKVVTCSGSNISMSSVSRSSTGTTKFTVGRMYGESDYSQFSISMSNSTSGTAYASGRVYMD